MDRERIERRGVRSFGYALAGLRLLLATQPHARIHAACTVAVVLTGWYVGVTRAEWCWIAFACMAVWSAEAFNTAIECLTDLVSPEFHPLAGRAKDTAAGAVLIAAIGAAIIGAMIFWPYLARSW